MHAVCGCVCSVCLCFDCVVVYSFFFACVKCVVACPMDVCVYIVWLCMQCGVVYAVCVCV